MIKVKSTEFDFQSREWSVVVGVCESSIENLSEELLELAIGKHIAQSIRDKIALQIDIKDHGGELKPQCLCKGFFRHPNCPIHGRKRWQL